MTNKDDSRDGTIETLAKGLTKNESEVKGRQREHLTDVGRAGHFATNNHDNDIKDDYDGGGLPVSIKLAEVVLVLPVVMMVLVMGMNMTMVVIVTVRVVTMMIIWFVILVLFVMAVMVIVVVLEAVMLTKAMIKAEMALFGLKTMLLMV